MSLFDPSIHSNAFSTDHRNLSKQSPQQEESAASFADIFQQTQQQATVATPIETTDEPTTNMSERNVVDEFMAWMQMTPAQQMRDRILKELGLTEEQLQDLPPEEQIKIEQLIAQKIREEMELQHNQPPTRDEEQELGA